MDGQKTARCLLSFPWGSARCLQTAPCQGHAVSHPSWRKIDRLSKQVTLPHTAFAICSSPPRAQPMGAAATTAPAAAGCTASPCPPTHSLLCVLPMQPATSARRGTAKLPFRCRVPLCQAPARLPGFAQASGQSKEVQGAGQQDQEGSRQSPSPLRRDWTLLPFSCLWAASEEEGGPGRKGWGLPAFAICNNLAFPLHAMKNTPANALAKLPPFTADTGSRGKVKASRVSRTRAWLELPRYLQAKPRRKGVAGPVVQVGHREQ